jgi:hypothetical protein
VRTILIVGVIALVVIGGAAALGIAGLGGLWFRRRRQ